MHTFLSQSIHTSHSLTTINKKITKKLFIARFFNKRTSKSFLRWQLYTMGWCMFPSGKWNSWQPSCDCISHACQAAGDQQGSKMKSIPTHTCWDVWDALPEHLQQRNNTYKKCPLEQNKTNLYKVKENNHDALKPSASLLTFQPTIALNFFKKATTAHQHYLGHSQSNFEWYQCSLPLLGMLSTILKKGLFPVSHEWLLYLVAGSRNRDMCTGSYTTFWNWFGKILSLFSNNKPFWKTDCGYWNKNHLCCISAHIQNKDWNRKGRSNTKQDHNFIPGTSQQSQ